MALVFLSHALDDKPAARRIADALRGAGHQPWIDDEDILVGESIPAALESALQNADFVVICLSKAAAVRGWIEAERDATLMQQLRERKERILPVRLEEIIPPYLLSSLAYVDLFPDDQAFERGITRLIRSIAKYEARDATPRDPPPFPDLGSSSITKRSLSTQSAHAAAVARPVPTYRDAAVKALSERLEHARARKARLRDAQVSTDDLDREILDLRRQLREGGRLLAGDALADGRYLLMKQAGRGGFAVVWEAFDTVTNRNVAIKVLHSHLAGDALRRERFFRGSRAMMKLAGPAVVRVLEHEGEDGGFHYFVMELVPGGNLSEAVIAGRLERTEIIPLILRVSESLAIAHANGMVHRDIKPSNILLDEEGNPKLADFDLVGTHDTTGGTRTGALGSLLYAAPECLDRPQEATARADVYGLGMTTIFCFSGRELTRSILRDAERTIAELRCSPELKVVLRQAVAWEPDERFADARAMRAALCAVPESSGLEPELPRGEPEPPQAKPGPRIEPESSSVEAATIATAAEQVIFADSGERSHGVDVEIASLAIVTSEDPDTPNVPMVANAQRVDSLIVSTPVLSLPSGNTPPPIAGSTMQGVGPPLDDRLRPMPPDRSSQALFEDAFADEALMSTGGDDKFSFDAPMAIEAPPMNVIIGIARPNPLLMREGPLAMDTDPTPRYRGGSEHPVVVITGSPDAPYTNELASLQSGWRRRRVMLVSVAVIFSGIAVLLGLALRDGVDAPAGGDGGRGAGSSVDPAPPPVNVPSAHSEPAVGATAGMAVADTTSDAGAASNVGSASRGSQLDAAAASGEGAAPVAGSTCFAEVSSEPAGADIVVDETRVIGTTPQKIVLPCGTPIDLTIRKSRLVAVTRTVWPTPQGARLSVALTKSTFLVKVSSSPPGATLSLNGKSVGVTPTTVKLPGFQISVLLISKDGYATASETLWPKATGLAVHTDLKRLERNK